MRLRYQRMDHDNLISRIEIAAEIGVQPQTIKHWERAGWFPRPKKQLSLKRIYYDRDEVKAALDARALRNQRARVVRVRKRGGGFASRLPPVLSGVSAIGAPTRMREAPIPLRRDHASVTKSHRWRSAHLPIEEGAHATITCVLTSI